MQCNRDDSFCLFTKVGVPLKGLYQKKIEAKRTVPSRPIDWLGIDEFRRDRPPPKKLQATDLFDDCAQNDYIASVIIQIFKVGELILPI